MAFEDDIREIQIKLDQGLEAIVAKTAFAILTGVTLQTPVGNPDLWKAPKAPPGYAGGHARRNWQVGIGVDPTTELEGVDASGQPTIDAARSALAGYRLGQDIVIANNVPYIEPLNQGHSTQAPSMFVEKVIDQVLIEVDSGPGPLEISGF